MQLEDSKNFKIVLHFKIISKLVRQNRMGKTTGNETWVNAKKLHGGLGTKVLTSTKSAWSAVKNSRIDCGLNFTIHAAILENI